MTVPIADAAGGWQWGLAVWGLLAVVGLAAWVARGWENRAGSAAELHWRRMLHSPLAWQVSMYLGAQSIGFYCMTTWMPAILRDAGLDPTRAGVMLSVSIGVGAVSGLVFGLGVAILLQQFAIVPLTLLLLVLVPLGGALVGVGLGWPRGGPR